MTALSEIEKIKILTGEQNEQLIEILLEDAEAFVKVLHRKNTDHYRTGKGSQGPGCDRLKPDGNRG